MEPDWQHAVPNSAERMLLLIKTHPTLLPRAPDHADAHHIEHRRLDEVHRCFRCGLRARCAFLVRSTEGERVVKRWLDLCAHCTHWLRVGIAPIDPPLWRP